MKRNLTLKRIDVAEDVFNSVLERFPDYIEQVDNIADYYKGYPEKWKIKYCEKTHYLICKECFVTDEADTDWKQVIVRLEKNLPDGKIVRSIDGSRAYAEVTKVLKKYYSDDEIDECLRSHEAQYDYSLAQQHFTYTDYFNSNVITKHSNCVKYDINGAHCDALREIFPKAAHYFEKLYRERKVNPVYKAYANYFVGMLAHKQYRLTYNWIVQRTTKMLIDACKQVGGELVYANTDGFAVTNPTKKLDKCKNNVLGWFKVEYEGDIYTYEGSNYWIMQCGDEIKGSAMNSVRPLINLREGKVVNYVRKAIKHPETNETLFYVPDEINIKTDVEIIER